MIKIIITLKDIETGHIVSFIEEHDSLSHVDFMWKEGNYACDCNRAQYFDINEDYPCNIKNRFLLISIQEEI